MTPWSYSRLTKFETCPKQHWALNISKTVKETPNEKTNYGNDLHLAFAANLRSGKALPLAMRQYQSMLDPIRAQPGEHVIEQKIAITQGLQPTDWFAHDVWLRVISDLTILKDTRAAIFDWKTGKMYDDFTQLRLTGAVLFLLAPEVEQVSLSYVWTQTKKVTSERLVKADVLKVWTGLAPRIRAYQTAHDTEAFPVKPGIHCKWCPLKSCPYNENKR
jgi:hypothetical protein